MTMRKRSSLLISIFKNTQDVIQLGGVGGCFIQMEIVYLLCGRQKSMVVYCGGGKYINTNISRVSFYTKQQGCEEM